jgi:hypothetical protein
VSKLEARGGPGDDVQLATLDAIRKARAAWLRQQEPADPEPEAAPEARDIRPSGGRSSRPLNASTRIECPECEGSIVVDPKSSILQSTRCDDCGHLLAFDEMIALRTAEHARASRYL